MIEKSLSIYRQTSTSVPTLPTSKNRISIKKI